MRSIEILSLLLISYERGFCEYAHLLCCFSISDFTYYKSISMIPHSGLPFIDLSFDFWRHAFKIHDIT